MQPIFLSFASGVAYRKIVKLHFRSISSIDQLVSISNYSTKVAKLLFLTAGNKSYCGTLQRLTHPQQSTDSPIPEPVSSSKRQVPQGKPFTLSSAPPRTSPHRHMPRATPPHHAPHHMPTPPARTTRPRHAPHRTPASHPHPTRSHTITTPKVACNSQTGVTQIYEAIRTSKVLRGNCMRNCGTPRHPISRPTPPRLSPASRSRTTRPCHIPPTLQHQPSPKSHAIPEQE